MCGLPLGSPEEGGDWRRVEARGREEGPREGLMTGAKANYGRQLGQAPGASVSSVREEGGPSCWRKCSGLRR